MKKLIFVLAICFIAAPAFAGVDVNLVDLGGGQVAIDYNNADVDNLPRAFALEVTIDGTGVFTDISGYKAEDFAVDSNQTGESNSLFPGYGIYPAQITWWLKPGDDACDVNSWGTPLANPIDPGAGDGIGYNNIVLEFASLYYGDANAPLSAGRLCVLDYTGDATAITMIDEDTYRGGLVFEDGSLGEVNDVLSLEEPECMKDTAAGYANWDAAGQPDCWCYQYQPLGDIDGLEQGIGPFAKRIASVDLGLFAPVYGKKRSQLAGNEICCDLDHLDQGIGPFAKAVASVDLGILATNYGKKTSQLDSSPYAGDYNFWITP